MSSVAKTCCEISVDSVVNWYPVTTMKCLVKRFSTHCQLETIGNFTFIPRVMAKIRKRIHRLKMNFNEDHSKW